jgi:hypothetical protein
VHSNTLMNEEVKHAATVRAVVEALPSESFVRQQLMEALKFVEEVVGSASEGPTEATPSSSGPAAEPSANVMRFASISGAVCTEANPRGGGDYLALAVHSLVRSSGFIATTFEAVHGAAAVPGFAAPLRLQDLPAGRACPAKWQSPDGDDGCCNFTYRDAKRTAFSVRTVNLGGLLVVHFGPSEGGAPAAQGVRVAGPRTLELSVEKHVGLEGGRPQWRCPDELEAAVAAIVAPEEPPVAPTPAVAAPPPLPQSAGGGVFPGRHGDFNGDLGRGGAPGNLMGPNHPMFQPRGTHPGPSPGGPHLPRPRFDPYGPVPSPSRPDHDHLRIPRFDDDPFADPFGGPPPAFGPMGGGPGFGPMGGDPLNDPDPLHLPRGRGGAPQRPLPRGPFLPGRRPPGPPPDGTYD